MSGDEFRHPMAWHGEEPAQGVFIGGEDNLNLLDMPTSADHRRNLALRGDTPITESARAVLAEVQSALDGLAEGKDAAKLLPLDALVQADRDFLAEALGTGEVTITIGGNPDYQIFETVLPGVWMGRATDTNGVVRADWIEVCDVPAVVRELVNVRCHGGFTPPNEVPEGAMNVQPVLAEIAERMAAFQPGRENHVMNFTLLPMTEVDIEVLTGTLGRLPMEIRSSGYGACKVYATHMKHVWAVQFLNAMETVILDTIEIGDVPVSVRAAKEDFEDSSERLREITEAYFQ